MPEPLWYYAQDGQERGPVSATQLKELAQAGILRSTDLVWREGMEDWSPASGVEGLPLETRPAMTVTPATATERARELSGSAAPKLQTTAASGHPSSDISQRTRKIGQPLLLLGIVLVVAARGCDSLGKRYVARINAKQAGATQQFDDEWKDKAWTIEDRLKALHENTARSSAENDELKDLTEEQIKLPQEQANAREKLEKNEWRALTIAARDAGRNDAMNAYWREWIFLVGTLALVIGLLSVGFTGEGGERWICLTMLAIITYSIYVGGIAWPGGAIQP